MSNGMDDARGGLDAALCGIGADVYKLHMVSPESRPVFAPSGWCIAVFSRLTGRECVIEFGMRGRTVLDRCIGP
jgi:hypothetical protein